MMKTFGIIPTDSAIFETPKSAEGHSINPQMFEMLKKAGPSPIYPGTFAEGLPTYAAFFRCDLGETPTDHHTFFILSNLDKRMAPDGKKINPQLSHVSYEVSSLDDVWKGHMQLKTKAEFKKERYKIVKSELSEATGKPGEVIDDLLTVACGKNSIRILEIQRQGKKVQNTSTFLLGSKIKKGVSLKRE